MSWSNYLQSVSIALPFPARFGSEDRGGIPYVFVELTVRCHETGETITVKTGRSVQPSSMLTEREQAEVIRDLLRIAVCHEIDEAISIDGERTFNPHAPQRATTRPTNRRGGEGAEVIAALFVQSDGCYIDAPGVDPWDEQRDARLYSGPHPVVAHPPCQLWVNLAAVNWKRYKRELPAWYLGGNDLGCFESALASVRKWGGVLEHPAGSLAFKYHGIAAPIGLGWQRILGTNEYVCEVWQSAYGHRARKRTWLFYVGEPPAELNWTARPGEAQVGWFDRNKPTVSKREASATPVAFRDALIGLARNSNRAKRAV